MGFGNFLKNNLGTIGGIIGQIAIPIPGVGAAIGASIGGLASGDKLGEALVGGGVAGLTGGALGGAASGAAGDVGGGFFKKFAGGKLGGLVSGFKGLSPEIQSLIIQGGGTLAASALTKAPKPEDFFGDQSIQGELGAIQREQFRRAATSLALGGERAIEQARAAGGSGSGLTAGLAPTFAAQGDALVGLLAQESDTRVAQAERELQRENALAQQRFQAEQAKQGARAEGITNIASSLSNSLLSKSFIDEIRSGDADGEGGGGVTPLGEETLKVVDKISIEREKLEADKLELEKLKQIHKVSDEANKRQLKQEQLFKAPESKDLTAQAPPDVDPFSIASTGQGFGGFNRTPVSSQVPGGSPSSFASQFQFADNFQVPQMSQPHFATPTFNSGGQNSGGLFGSQATSPTFRPQFS